MSTHRPNLRPPAGGLLIANPPAPCSPAPGLPLPRRPAPRRLLVTIALAVLLIAAAAPAVSAEIIIDKEFSYYEDTGGTYNNPGKSNVNSDSINVVKINNIENHPDVSYIAFTTTLAHIDSVPAEGVHEFTYTGLGAEKTGRYHLNYIRNSLGIVTGYRYIVFFDDWYIGEMAGPIDIVVSTPFFTGRHTGDGNTNNVVNIASNRYYASAQYSITIASTKIFKNHLTVIDDGYSYDITLKRVYDLNHYASVINLTKNNNLILSDGYTDNFHTIYPKYAVDLITISAGTRVFTAPLGITTDSQTVAIYVQNSQTGALLADANLSILAATGGIETEVVNATLPGGVGVYTLQPTGGGLPNPDYYRAVSTVPGFSQIIENHSFTLNGPHDVIIEMRPDSGGPTDPERAYLEFYVRDLNANPIPSASIQCGGRILQTNSAGYAVFEVAKNSTHPWIAKKSGYTTIEGTATVADGPRYVVNVVLGTATLPTYTPTQGPGETPTPDTRTNEQKGQEVIDLIADFALPIAILAILATLSGLLSMMMPRRR